MQTDGWYIYQILYKSSVVVYRPTVCTLLQTYLGEIVRSSDERHSDVGRQIVVRMPRCDAADAARFRSLLDHLFYGTQNRQNI